MLVRSSPVVGRGPPVSIGIPRLLFCRFDVVSLGFYRRTVGFPLKRSRKVQKFSSPAARCFSLGPRAVLGGAYMLVRRHACSDKGV